MCCSLYTRILSLLFHKLRFGSLFLLFNFLFWVLGFLLIRICSAVLLFFWFNSWIGDLCDYRVFFYSWYLIIDFDISELISIWDLSSSFSFLIFFVLRWSFKIEIEISTLSFSGVRLLRFSQLLAHLANTSEENSEKRSYLTILNKICLRIYFGCLPHLPLIQVLHFVFIYFNFFKVFVFTFLMWLELHEFGSVVSSIFNWKFDLAFVTFLSISPYGS